MKNKSRVTDFDKQVGINIHALREVAFLTQEQIAAHLGVTFQQIQKYERGVNRLPLKSAQELAYLFKVPITALLPDDTASSHNKWDSLKALSTDRDFRKLVAIWERIDDPAVKHILIKLLRQALHLLHPLPAPPKR